MKKTVLAICLLFLAVVACTPPASASQSAASRPIAFDDFISIKRVTDLQLSPDGSSIAYVVTVMDKAANRGASDIWLVPARGGEPRRLTSSPAADMNPRWSPDGRTIAFISSRSGSPQVWKIDPNGGEAVQVSRISTGASGVAWSPKGTHLAFVSSVFPDCPDDESNRNKTGAVEASKVKGRLFDHLLIRHWNAWSDGTRSHLFVVPASGGTAVDITPGDFDVPPIALGGAQDYAFAPDGTEIAFVRNTDPEFLLGLGTNNDIFVTGTGGGKMNLLTVNKANDHSPGYSPDGHFLAYLAMARPGFEADKQSLMLYDRKTGVTDNLTGSLDYSVGGFLWAPGSAAIYFDSEEKGRTAVFRFTLATKKLEKVLEGHTLSALALSPDGRTLYFLKQALHRPNDVWSLDLKTKTLAQVTRVNAELLAGLDMNPAEEFWYDGAAGDKVHGFLLKPPAFDPARKYPLLMLIHGGPQGSFGDNFHYRWNAQMFAAAGYVTAMVNFHGSTGYGQAFTDSITGDWGGKPYQDILKAVGYLHGAFPFIDMTKLGAAGASYGGYMIDWIEGQTDIFDCLISHDGVFDLRSMYGATEELWFPEWEYHGTPWTSPEQYTKWSPSMYVKNFKTPCLVVHSANDFRVPLEQGLQFFTSLQRMGVPSKLLYFPDEDHFISKPQNAELWWKTLHEWLAIYLK
ncbi:MAG: S9 family peptidase [Candidatus Aminicenantes bacterium]|nr:S9 family peptidase [Candidatus Aminicenantes bacterium]TFG55891.1 MAG: S9 family peptidase [Candidatus Aminicenantes bacterium]